MEALFPKLPRIIYNDDSCTLRVAPQPHTLDSLDKALDYLATSQVDCLCWLLGEQVAYGWPSDVMENMFELQAKIGVLTKGWECSANVMFSLYQQGIDYLPHLIERAHARGLTFIGSFRLNDTHLKSYPNSVHAPEFWKKNQDYRLWEVSDGKSYYNAALDYSYPEVRNRYRDAIVEVLERYDVDGIELDLTRTPYFFQPSEAWEKRGILTEFVRDIRREVDRASEAKQRALTFIIRTPCAKRALTTGGIDIEKWVEEKIPHILVVSSLANDYNLDLAPWLKLCRENGVLLYPAVESLSAYNNVDFYSTLIRNQQAPRHDGSGGPVRSLEEDVRLQCAAAQNFLAQNPDGIYMFNFACRLAEGENLMHNDANKFELLTSLLREMGCLKTLERKNKLYTFYPELPIYVEAMRPRRFHQTIPFQIRGEDVRGGEVTVRFRQIAERNPHADGDFVQSSIVKPGLLRYYLNEVEIPEEAFERKRVPAGQVHSGFTLGEHERMEFTFSGEKLSERGNTLSFEIPSFPQEEDPYVYIYDLEVEVVFS